MKAYLFQMVFPGMQSPVWRRFAIASDAHFADLAAVCEICAGYSHGYDWEFLFSEIPARITNHAPLLEQADYFRRRREEAEAMEVEDELDHSVAVRDGAETPLAPLVERYEAFRYLYDFTDEWVWELSLVETVEDWEGPLPHLLDGLGTAPFEDAGDIEGHYEILGALASADGDPALRQWMQEKGWRLFDPAAANDQFAKKG